jgi:hypothetical protein
MAGLVAAGAWVSLVQFLDLSTQVSAMGIGLKIGPTPFGMGPGGWYAGVLVVENIP